MAKRTILVDSARRELEKHGTETFPMTVNHDDLWSFEGKNVPIHWHNDLEINLIREGEAVRLVPLSAKALEWMQSYLMC